MQVQHFGAKMPSLSRGNMWISGEAWTDTNVTRGSLLKIPINLRLISLNTSVVVTAGRDEELYLLHFMYLYRTYFRKLRCCQEC